MARKFLQRLEQVLDEGIWGKNPYENKYCPNCKGSTKHENKNGSYSCLVCGSIKYRVQNRIPGAVVQNVPRSNIDINI